MTDQEIVEFYQAGQVLCFDKPLEWTSFDVVKKVKAQFRHRLDVKKIKIGHAGTLDPLATGLLIVCTGKKTKSIQEIQDGTKHYIAEVTLGATRPSYDMETEIDQEFPTDYIQQETIEKVIQEQFSGEIDQFPPIFSALKVQGKKAYDLARAGKEVELKSRRITIHDIELLNFEDNVCQIHVHCSKGTYIRSLAHDLGKALNSGAYLSGLRRTVVGEYSLENAINPDTFEVKDWAIGEFFK